jgi:hypothetical protein
MDLTTDDPGHSACKQQPTACSQGLEAVAARYRGQRAQKCVLSSNEDDPDSPDDAHSQREEPPDSEAPTTNNDDLEVVRKSTSTSATSQNAHSRFDKRYKVHEHSAVEVLGAFCIPCVLSCVLTILRGTAEALDVQGIQTLLLASRACYTGQWWCPVHFYMLKVCLLHSSV